jgi:hypothetical protein
MSSTGRRKKLEERHEKGEGIKKDQNHEPLPLLTAFACMMQAFRYF